MGEVMSNVLQEAEEFIANNWDPNGDPDAWRELVIDSGWAALRWPTQWFGRGLSDDDAAEVEALFLERGVPGPGQDKTNLWAGTMLSYGSDELKSQFMRKLLLDEIAMCLLYSEPGAGSDLAGIRTSAVRDGNEWVVNGQKVWTSGAAAADYGMLIARTDWDQPKHRGISFFWLPMKQAGVEVRPLRQATGDARFNEVFITDARVADSHRLGDLNSGWMVLQTALMYERVAMGGGRRGPAMRSTKGATAAAHGSIPMPDTSLVALAKKVGKTNDPHFRQELMKLYCRRMTNEWNAERARAAAEAGGASPLASLGKLNMAEILHYAARIQGHLLGMNATLLGAEDSVEYAHNYSQLNAYFFSIGGGTDQIQRNIIGERVLGLPKEPETDRNIAFREVPARG